MRLNGLINGSSFEMFILNVPQLEYLRLINRVNNVNIAHERHKQENLYVR
jgi:hypothetical protein